MVFETYKYKFDYNYFESIKIIHLAGILAS